jgi:hypothetical protein
MINFLINGVLASIIGSIILIVIGGLVSRYARWLLTGILGRLLDVDIEYVFRSKTEADEDIERELKKASFVYLLTGRGNDLQRGLFTKVLYRKPRGKLSEFRILLPLPQKNTSGTDWITQRENELAAFDPAFGNGVLRHQIEMTIKYLENYVSTGEIELKLCDYPHIGRILITDRVVYFTPYSIHAHGQDSRIIKHRRGGEFYECFSRLFNQLWEVSVPVGSKNSVPQNPLSKP